MFSSKSQPSKPPTKIELNQMLIEAAANGKTRRIKDFIAKGADVLNPKEHGTAHTALKEAARKGHVEIVKILLPYVENLICYDILCTAAENGHNNVVKVLFPYLTIDNASASKKTTDSFKNVAFLYSVRNGHVNVVNILLSHFDAAALLKTVDNNGNTPLILAAQNGHLSVIETLMAAGADVTVENGFKLDAVEIACLHNERNAALRLLSAMPAQFVINFQEHAFNSIRSFATQCRQAVIAIQNVIFGTFSLFRSKMLPTNQPGIIDSTFSYLFPEWYRHRATRDTELIFTKIRAVLNTKAEKAKERKRAHLQTSPALLMAPAATFLPALTAGADSMMQQQQASVVLPPVEENADVIEQGRNKKAKPEQ
jgi:hypothetical protein